jgi:hypothetical protein
MIKVKFRGGGGDNTDSILSIFLFGSNPFVGEPIPDQFLLKLICLIILMEKDSAQLCQLVYAAAMLRC